MFIDQSGKILICFGLQKFLPKCSHKINRRLRKSATGDVTKKHVDLMTWIFKPASDFDVIKSNCFDFYQASLVSCEILCISVAKHGLLLSIVFKVLAEPNLVHVIVTVSLLLSSHLSCFLEVFLPLNPLSKGKLVFGFFVLFRLFRTDVFLLELFFCFELALSGVWIDTGLFEWHDRLSNRELHLVAKVIFEVLKTLFKVHLTACGKYKLTLFANIEFNRRICSIQLF